MELDQVTQAFAEGSTPLIRTDFTNDEAWQRVVHETSQPMSLAKPDSPESGHDAYTASLVVLEDRAFEGISAAALGETFLKTDDEYGYVLLADARTMNEVLAGEEVTLDYVDLSVPDAASAELFNSYLGRSFRCVIPEVASVEANLSISSLGFHEYADSADPDGVFRGFDH